MDGQCPERPHSRTPTGRMSSAVSQNSRISLPVSTSTKDASCMKVPQDSARRDRWSHPTTILLHKSQSSQATLMPQEHGMFMAEAYSAATCFKMLQDMNSADPFHLKYIIKKIKNMAHGSPKMVMETIHDYFIDNPEISSRHKFRLFQALEMVIRASDVLEETWEKTFTRLALENMTKATELEDIYQDAASNVLVAICRHSWRVVVQHLETELLTGVFPHRSLLYVMGVLSSSEELFSQEDKACWEEQLIQMAIKSVPFLRTDVWSKELLWTLTTPSWTPQEQSPEKAFLFAYYGLILQAEKNSATVRRHLQALLETSHQWPMQREGMALTLGLAATHHLDDVWAVLDQFGRSRPIRWSLHSFSPKNSEDLHWKWASSTILLAYGQVAAKARAHILPWVDNIVSRMVFYFHYSSWSLYSRTTEALDLMLQSLIMQNPTAGELHFLLSHLYTWLASEKAHERQRAVHSCMILLKFLNHNGYLDPKENFKRIGQLVGILGMLCQDPDKATQRCSLEGASHLYQLLMRHKAGETLQAESQAPKELSQAHSDGTPLWNSRDQKATPLSPQEMAKNHIFQLCSSQVIKEIMQQLTLAELNDLIWTAIDSLGSTSPFHVQAASEMLLTAIQEHGAKLKIVSSMAQAIGLRLCSVHNPQAQEKTLHAITLLARNHTRELVATFLDISIPLDSHTFQLWRALGAEQPTSHLVLTMLLAWLQERPLPTGASDSSPCPKEKTYLRSLAAMNMLRELQFAREFKQAVQEAYPKLFLALLTQTHYVLELNLPGEPQPKQQAQEAAMPSPQSCSTSLEALKRLLSTTGHWHDFAHLELQGSWELFATIHTYPKGVGLLARAMVHNHCRQITVVLRQLLPSLQSPEERDRKVAILILTEFLYSPALLEVLPKQAALTVLAQGLHDPSPEVRVLSLQGLSNILFHPDKGSLLRGQLRPFLDGFFQSSEQVILCIMGTVSDTLHRLGAQGAGSQSLSVAISARSFFNDERNTIRAAAMALFGDLVAATADRELSGLRTQVHQSMVPLLLHLKDQCPAVATQAKFAFYRCAVLLRWRLLHTLFCTLAWERGLSARHFLWTCLMTRSQEEFSIHLSQALSHLHSHSHHIKTWAALFIGHTICYHPQAVFQMLNAVDTNLLFCTFERLKSDPEPSIREFATGQLSFLQKVSARPKQ
ncbi:maestro heat-like repeat family member 5 isoform X2 [Symphalangus syndactylus]|uniref:maestro heat-like repeat family member 5 isoform X2 n=2 Tax=Symphalangus syndactylus TaxID=9590 RepID=UPI00244186A2|nr:maestro heat-like repeat family member 5 isoform X2 [Symphalangus syndactylus]